MYLWHHPILHEDKPIIESATWSRESGSVKVCSATKDTVCLLQIQKIKSRKNFVNVMWDSAASLCFITNNKAKAEKLKGEEVELTITKVGGKAKKLRSCKYSLPLIDVKGNEVHFDAYGIDKITNEVESIDSSYITQLFKNVSAKDKSSNRRDRRTDRIPISCMSSSTRRQQQSLAATKESVWKMYRWKPPSDK